MSDLKTLAPEADTTDETALTDKELDDVVAGGSPLLFEYCAHGNAHPKPGRHLSDAADRPEQIRRQVKSGSRPPRCERRDDACRLTRGWTPPVRPAPVNAGRSNP
jgi:hypothetical protein